MQYSTWTVIFSLRDLDRWLVYSVCSGCSARWALDYTYSSAVFDFGKGREVPQHARRSLWRVILGGFLTSNDWWWTNECSLWSVIFREFLTLNGCERSEQMSVESVERTYIYLLNTWTQYPPERFYASYIRSSSVYRVVSMHGESRPNTSKAIYIFSDIVDSYSNHPDFASSPISQMSQPDFASSPISQLSQLFQFWNQSIVYSQQSWIISNYPLLNAVTKPAIILTSFRPGIISTS